MNGKNERREWDWGLIGKANALIGRILSRVRAITDKDFKLDWSFLEWLAEAPDKVYSDALGVLLNAWKVAESAKINQERMEKLVWSRHYCVAPNNWNEPSPGNDPTKGPWRYPTLLEMIWAHSQTQIVIYPEYWYKCRDESGEFIFATCLEGGWRNIAMDSDLGSTKCFVIFVRDALPERNHTFRPNPAGIHR